VPTAVAYKSKESKFRTQTLCSRSWR